MTREEFLTREIYIWGEEYIFSLIELGYQPHLTDRGWVWLMPVTRANRFTSLVRG